MNHLRIFSAAIFSSYLYTGFAISSELVEKPFIDSELAVELAKAYLKSQFRKHPGRKLPGINWSAPYISVSYPVNGRYFVFVGFLSTQPNSGATIVFESCSTTPFLLPQHAGAQAEFMESYKYYDSLQIKETDMESICPEPYE